MEPTFTASLAPNLQLKSCSMFSSVHSSHRQRENAVGPPLPERLQRQSSLPTAPHPLPAVAAAAGLITTVPAASASSWC
jgi:hypothetical protein